MFRFTIRDVLWLTVVVGMGVTWWMDRASLDVERESLKVQRRKFEEKFLRLIDNAERASQVGVMQSPSEGELARIKEQSAKLGVPQPQPLPLGYGETPNKE